MNPQITVATALPVAIARFMTGNHYQAFDKQSYDRVTVDTTQIRVWREEKRKLLFIFPVRRIVFDAVIVLVRGKVGQDVDRFEFRVMSGEATMDEAKEVARQLLEHLQNRFQKSYSAKVVLAAL